MDEAKRGAFLPGKGGFVKKNGIYASFRWYM
jgi:hypothetical protein